MPDFPADLIQYYGFAPRVVDAASTTSPYFYIQTDGTPTSAQLRLANGSTVALTDGGGGQFHITLTHAQALLSYSASKYNHGGGKYACTDAGLSLTTTTWNCT